MEYLNSAMFVERRDATFQRAVQCLSRFEFDTIVVTGVSGLIIGPVLAHLTGKKLLVVRKPNESTHSYNYIEGEMGHQWIFVDDFISSGGTLDRVVERVNVNFGGVKFVGFYSYFYEGSSHDVHVRACRRHKTQYLNQPYPMPPLPRDFPQSNELEPKAIPPLGTLYGFPMRMSDDLQLGKRLNEYILAEIRPTP